MPVALLPCSRLPAECVPEPVLGGLELLAPCRGEVLAGAIDINTSIDIADRYGLDFR
jgi:hypothetical protein